MISCYMPCVITCMKWPLCSRNSGITATWWKKTGQQVCYSLVTDSFSTKVKPSTQTHILYHPTDISKVVTLYIITKRTFALFTGQIVKINMSRLLLCEATSQIMMTGFKILGIRTLSRM